MTQARSCAPATQYPRSPVACVRARACLRGAAGGACRRRRTISYRSRNGEIARRRLREAALPKPARRTALHKVRLPAQQDLSAARRNVSAELSFAPPYSQLLLTNQSSPPSLFTGALCA